MTSDDDRIGYLGGDDASPVDDADRGGLDDLRALLADPSVWAEPDAGLEDAVVAAIAGDATGTRSMPRARPRRSRRRAAGALVGAAAAVAALVGAVALMTGGDAAQATFTAALAPPEQLHPIGSASFTKTDSGWRIELDASGLPRLDHGRFYQAWLRDEAGTLVTIGTFNEPHDVVLWAGVSPADYPTITVTEEAADNDPASSGHRVLVGPITKSP